MCVALAFLPPLPLALARLLAAAFFLVASALASSFLAASAFLAAARARLLLLPRVVARWGAPPRPPGQARRAVAVPGSALFASLAHACART